MTESTPQKKHSRLWLYLPWGIFSIGAVAWCFYWFALAHQVESHLTQWVAAQNQLGGEAHIGAITRHGFPAMMRYDLVDVTYAPRERPFALHTAHATLHVNLTHPRNLILERKAPFTLTHGAQTSSLDANTAVLSFTLAEDGLSYAGLEADRVTLSNMQAEGRTTLGHFVANTRPDPRNAADWQIALLVDNAHLALPVRAFEALGQDLPRLEAAIVWTPAHRARFEALETQWGPVHINLLGELGLDDAHRLEGHLDVAAPRDALRFASSELRASILARQPTQDPIHFSLTAEDGALRADRLTVRNLAPLD